MQNSKIQWCDHTFNPWEGCTKVSPGCVHCYAEARNNRFISRKDRAKGIGGNWGKGKPRRRTSAANWKLPLKWNLEAAKAKSDAIVDCVFTELDAPQNPVTWHRPRVFCASLADWLDDEVPIEWLADLLKLIHDTPNLDWLLLTKRPENWLPRLGEILRAQPVPHERNSLAAFIGRWLTETPPQNVWIGASAEDQPRAEDRIPELLKIPAKVRFLSVEPMLGPIDFSEWFWESGCKPHCGDKCSKDADCPIEPTDKIHWVIFGGESATQERSGPGARPCNIEWIRDGVNQCRAAGIAPFVKQLGGNLSDVDLDECNRATGKAVHDRKGGDITEWPEDLRIRQFPTQPHKK